MTKPAWLQNMKTLQQTWDELRTNRMAEQAHNVEALEQMENSLPLIEHLPLATAAMHREIEAMLEEQRHLNRLLGKLDGLLGPKTIGEKRLAMNDTIFDWLEENIEKYPEFAGGFSRQEQRVDDTVILQIMTRLDSKTRSKPIPTMWADVIVDDDGERQFVCNENLSQDGAHEEREIRLTAKTWAPGTHIEITEPRAT